MHLICIPTDLGANMAGASLGPRRVMDALFDRDCHPDNTFVSQGASLRHMLAHSYVLGLDSIRSKRHTAFLGGDHSVSIATVASANDACNERGEALGVLWCDAHADFNTLSTSPSGNLHGMSVSVLCGHTWDLFRMGSSTMHPCQFAYWGVRDMDCMEKVRMEKEGMTHLHSEDELEEWASRFDKVHVSFDMDCLDPSFAPGVSTPVSGGKSVEEAERMIGKVRQLGKLVSMDIVELNPTRDVDAKTEDAACRLLESAFG